MQKQLCWLATLITGSILYSITADIVSADRPEWASDAETTATAGPSVEKPSSTPSSSTLSIEPYRFEHGSGEIVEAELGKFRVPENRRDAESRQIELAFVRFPATTPTPGPPIVYLAGGPGGSGISTAKGRRFPLFMALRELGDVIAFDQRGTGFSNSIPTCAAPTPWPLEKPSSRAEALPWLASTAEHCAQFWRRQGVDIDGYNTVESADDLDALRRELGVEKLRLWSISYGTHLAFATVRRHGEHIDRVVLASAEGPDETIKLPSRTQAFFDKILSEQDRVALRRVLDRLDKEPVVVATRHPRTQEPARVGIGKLDLQILLGFLIKNPDTQATLSMSIAAWDQGDFSAIAPYLVMMAEHMRGMGGMSEAMDAASGISAARRERVRREQVGTLLEDALNFPGLALAEPLGITDLGDSFRGPLRCDVPALFLSGDLDGRTYVESHRELAAGFKNGVQVIVQGAGHDLFMASPEVTERIMGFMAGKTISTEPIHVPAPR